MVASHTGVVRWCQQSCLQTAHVLQTGCVAHHEDLDLGVTVHGLGHCMGPSCVCWWYQLAASCALSAACLHVPSDRSASITRLRDQYNDSHWRGPLEAWVASDASAVIEHTKRWVG